jgi:hypothetical protein
VVCLILEGGIVGKVEARGVCWGRDLGVLRHPETAREAWLNALLAVCFGLWNLSVLAPWASRVYCSWSGSGQIRHARRAVLCWLPEFGCLCKELY